MSCHVQNTTKKKIIWLISYPKSGNTWLRNILSKSLFRNNSIGIDIHAHDVNVKSCEDSPVFLKSHFQWPLYHSIIKSFPKKSFSSQIEYIKNNTIGYIYIYRHPLDVLISTLFYLANEVKMENTKKWFDHSQTHKSIAEYIRDDEFRTILDIFYNGGHIPAFTNAGYGTWSENVMSWLKISNKLPIMFVKYEDLLERPYQIIEQMASFCGYLSIEKEKIQEIIKENTIENLRKKTKNDYKFFFRKGVYGDFYNYIEEDYVSSFYQKNKEIMDKLNYLYLGNG